MTALLSDMSIFCVRGGCEIRMESYAPNTYRSLFLISYFAHAYSTSIYSYMGRSAYRTTTILLETFLCGLELHKRFDWRATARATHRSFSDTTMLHCVRILQACIYIANCYATTPDNKTRGPYNRILRNKRRLDCH